MLCVQHNALCLVVLDRILFKNWNVYSDVFIEPNGSQFTIMIKGNRCNPEFGIEWENPAYRGGTNKSVLFHSIENHIPYH